MLWKSTLAFLLVLVIGGFSGNAFSADLKIAVVNASRLLKEAPQFKTATQKLEKEFSSRNNKLNSLGKQLKEMEDKLSRDGKIMSESEVRRLERDIVSRRRDLRNEKRAMQEDLQLRKNEEIDVAHKVISEVIAELAKKEKLDLVLNELSIVWSGKTLDITDKVIDALENR